MEAAKHELACLMDRQREIQDKLLELETQKKAVLVKGSVEELNELLKAEQPLLMQSSNLESQRQELQSRLKISQDEMRRIFKNPVGAEEAELVQSFRDLRDAVMTLKKASDLNGRVLKARMDTKKNLMRIFGMSEETSTYSK